MNRKSKRKAIDKLARHAIKTGRIDVAMGLGQKVVNRICKIKHITIPPQMQSTEALQLNIK